MKVIINHAGEQQSKAVIFYIPNCVLHGALLGKISKFEVFFPPKFIQQIKYAFLDCQQLTTRKLSQGVKICQLYSRGSVFNCRL
jgi:hypothetical protein